MCDDKRGVKNKTSDNNGCNPLEECCHLIFMNHAIGILFQLSFKCVFYIVVSGLSDSICVRIH